MAHTELTLTEHGLLLTLHNEGPLSIRGLTDGPSERLKASFALEQLRREGLVEGSRRGIWAITRKGRSEVG